MEKSKLEPQPCKGNHADEVPRTSLQVLSAGLLESRSSGFWEYKQEVVYMLGEGSLVGTMEEMA